MGLDQYAFIVKKHEKNTDFSVHWLSDEVSENMKSRNIAPIAEWRKHPHLQGWMERLFNTKADSQDYTGTVMPGGIGDEVDLVVSPHGQDGKVIEPDQETVEKIREALVKINEGIKEISKDEKLSRVFNTQPIRLTLTDLEQLETAINRGELPKSSGFFWGEDSSEHYKEQDLEFVRSARQAIINGNEVYYDSWW